MREKYKPLQDQEPDIFSDLDPAEYYREYAEIYSFEDFIKAQEQRTDKDQAPRAQYTVIANLNDKPEKKTKTVLIRSRLEGHPDLYCIGIWDKVANEPRGKTVLNWYDLERLYHALDLLLRGEL